MESKSKIIAGFVIVALLIWVFMLVLDYLFPPGSSLAHIWHAIVVVMPPFAIFLYHCNKSIKQAQVDGGAT